MPNARTKVAAAAAAAIIMTITMITTTTMMNPPFRPRINERGRLWSRLSRYCLCYRYRYFLIISFPSKGGIEGREGGNGNGSNTVMDERSVTMDMTDAPCLVNGDDLMECNV